MDSDQRHWDVPPKDYSENDLLFLLPLCNDLWFSVLEALLIQYKGFEDAKEDF
jgi:hypothetical protein